MGDESPERLVDGVSGTNRIGDNSSSESSRDDESARRASTTCWNVSRSSGSTASRTNARTSSGGDVGFSTSCGNSSHKRRLAVATSIVVEAVSTTSLETGAWAASQ